MMEVKTEQKWVMTTLQCDCGEEMEEDCYSFIRIFKHRLYVCPKCKKRLLSPKIYPSYEIINDDS